VSALLLGLVAVIGLTATTLRAHEVTYRGTVQAVATDHVQVQTLADDGSESEVISFTVTPDTKVERGDTAVVFSAAGIQAGERIVVIVDHDEDETAAIEIRLAAR